MLLDDDGNRCVDLHDEESDDDDNEDDKDYATGSDMNGDVPIRVAVSAAVFVAVTVVSCMSSTKELSKKEKSG